jgi:hypothetical protein
MSPLRVIIAVVGLLALLFLAVWEIVLQRASR